MLALLFVISLSLAQEAQNCVIYRCGNIQNDKPDPLDFTCGQYTDGTYRLADCPQEGEDYYCSTSETIVPSSLNRVMECLKNFPAPLPANLAPGDRCLESESCFGSSTCVDGVCILEGDWGKIGEECKELEGDEHPHKSCQAGSYCSLDNKCSNVVGFGQVCNVDDAEKEYKPCGFG